MQGELIKIFNWLVANGLTLNLTKTNYVLFHIRRPFPIQIDSPFCLNNQPISRLTEIKYLGVILDQHLTWIPHINKVKISLSRAYHIIRRLSYIIPPQALILTFFSIFHSHLNYATVVWGHVSENKLRPLSSILARAIALVNRVVIGNN